MHMPLETLAADTAPRNARGARAPREHPEPREAAAMLTAARRIVATTRVAFAAADRPARAPSTTS